MPRHYGAWLRYGAPLTEDQVRFAIDNYQVAILQPWETDALVRMKAARPDMTILCYKCLSSTRDYEPGPIFSSGVTHTEAEEAGEHWFAHRADGISRIEWNTYPGHWQMAVWDEDYRARWCANVVNEVVDSLWDGVMADNDVFDDYYGLRPPLEQGKQLSDIRQALDALVTTLGPRLNAAGKILIPNIAESRREPGRWARHAAYGGGYEEVWLAYGPDDYLDVATVLSQADEVTGPGLSIMRVASDGTSDHSNVTYGLAAFWVFGGGAQAAYAATAHDGYSGTPFHASYNWDLGEPLEPARRKGNSRYRAFTNGWAGVNFNMRAGRAVTLKVPPGLKDVHGRESPARVTLKPHEGRLYVRDSAYQRDGATSPTTGALEELDAGRTSRLT